MCDLPYWLRRMRSHTVSKRQWHYEKYRRVPSFGLVLRTAHQSAMVPKATEKQVKSTEGMTQDGQGK